MCKTFWSDERGGILCAELVLCMTLLSCACVVGLGSLRNAIATELADLAGAIGVLNQSYSVGGILGYHSYCAGQVFVDRLDSGDLAVADGVDGVRVCVAALGNEAGAVHRHWPATGQLIAPPPPPDVHPPLPCPPPIIHPPVPPCPPAPPCPPVAIPCPPAPPCPPVVIPCPPGDAPCGGAPGGCVPGHHAPKGSCWQCGGKCGHGRAELHQRIEVEFGHTCCPRCRRPCVCEHCRRVAPPGNHCEEIQGSPGHHHHAPELAAPEPSGEEQEEIEPLPAPWPERNG